MIVHPHKDIIPADTDSTFWALDDCTIISDDKKVVTEWGTFGFVMGTVITPTSCRWCLSDNTDFLQAVRRILRCTLGRDPWFPVTDVQIYSDNVTFDYHFGSPFYSGLACYTGKPVMRLEPAFQRACRFNDMMKKVLIEDVQDMSNFNEIYEFFWSRYLPLRMEIADATDTSTLYRSL